MQNRTRASILEGGGTRRVTEGVQKMHNARRKGRVCTATPIIAFSSGEGGPHRGG